MGLPAGVAFLFDLDGVIVDSTPVHNQAWELYLRSHKLPVAGIQERMFGKHNDEIVFDFFGPDLSPAEIKRHGAAKERLYRELLQGSVAERLVPGIGAFLERSAEIPKAVASNAEPANVAFILAQSGLGSHFLGAVDGSQVERPKPAPDIYHRAAALAGVEARHCIVFEDSPVGVTAARAAGARVVGLRTTVDAIAGVDVAIRDFTDPALGAWIESLR